MNIMGRLKAEFAECTKRLICLCIAVGPGAIGSRCAGWI